MTEPTHIQPFSLNDYETRFADRHLLHGALTRWAAERPEAPALVSADGSHSVSWSEFDRVTSALASELLRLGFVRGDFLVTLLPMSVDHVLLEYSCFKIGVIVAPLDLRLPPAEVVRAVEILRPRGFVFPGASAPLDFSAMARAVQAACPWIAHCIAMGSAGDLRDVLPFAALAEPAWSAARSALAAADAKALAAASAKMTADDGALVIFTTGSTGSPKPALLSHRNITVQNMCLSGAFFGGDRGTRTLVNLPASHVGGQTEALMSTLFGGGTAVLLEVFDAARSMRAIGEHRVEILGQIPAMFSLEWMLKDYARHDLSSLRFAAYGGTAVSRAFVEQLAGMAPLVGTGLGLTECAGFCTYVQASAKEHELIVAGLGVDMPIYPCTIRQPMREDGRAGEELASGAIGHVCFRGPQTFLGYVNDPEATAKAISSDGYLYTGDLGYKNETGLHLTGRDKWVIKSMGYQIFPGDVEAHIARLSEKVASSVVVGVRHEVVSEAPVAVVELRPNSAVSLQELDKHARELPSYMRPRHWILIEAGTMPLNRVAKPDHHQVQRMADEAIAQLRERGEWDRQYRAE